MSPSTLLMVILAVPMITGVAVLLFGKNPNGRDSATVAGGLVLAALTVKLHLIWQETGSAGLELHMFELVGRYPIGFKVEPLGLLFATVAAFLWPVTSIYAVGYMRGHNEENQTRFFFCFALAITAALMIAFSRNLVTLFIFYEFMTLATYPLVTHHGTDKARKAGRIYLGILMTTSICLLLPAIIWTGQLAGTTEFTPGGILRGRTDATTTVILVLLFAYGTGKAALMPIHRWLPNAMVAPTPVSALLHAVAVVKAGVFTILKIAVYTLGTGWLTETGASTWLVWAASFTILSASVVAMGQDNLKARLAYSTISQLAYIILGAALASVAGIMGAALHILMHAVGKITLFFCAGAVYVAGHKSDVSAMKGIGRRMPWTMAAFAVASASIAGLPFVGGVWSKWYLGLGAAQNDAWLVVGVLALSSLFSIGYLGPVITTAFFAPLPEGAPTDNLEKKHPFLYLPPVLTAAGCVLLFFFSQYFFDLLRPLVGG